MQRQMQTHKPERAKPIQPGRGERGFSLALVAVSAFVLLAMVGLAFDAGRMFIVKNELQTFVDASAVAAVGQMDGTQAGIQTANTTATQGPLGRAYPNGYNFDSTPVSNVTATYATTLAGTYDSYPTAQSASTNNYRFIKVTASASVPLNFLPVLPGISSPATLSSSAVAGQRGQPTFTNGGLQPFLPDAHDTTDTKNFGFTPGVEYTLKWGNGSTTCAGDQGWTDPNPAPQHGFVDLGQGTGASSLTQLIEWGGYPNASSTPSSVYSGMILYGDSGNRGTQVFTHLGARAAQDTDDTSTGYSDYISRGSGNGRRIVITPVGDPSTWDGRGNGSEQVIGFAAFFLDTSYAGNSASACATYIGPANMNGNGGGATDGSKVYYNVLFQ